MISECKYSYVGLSVLLKKHYGAYDIRLFSDFMHGGAKAEKITKHDIALIFTSQNLEQSVNVIESPGVPAPAVQQQNAPFGVL